MFPETEASTRLLSIKVNFKGSSHSVNLFKETSILKKEIYPLIQELPIRVKLFTFQQKVQIEQTKFDICAGLKDLGAERRAKLDDALKLFMLNREVDDLEQWIVEQEVVAGSHEFGQDYEHVTLLVERFKEFAKEF